MVALKQIRTKLSLLRRKSNLLKRDVYKTETPSSSEPKSRLVQKEHQAGLPQGVDEVVGAPGHQGDVGRPGTHGHEDRDVAWVRPDGAARLQTKGLGPEKGHVQIGEVDVVPRCPL